MATKRALRTQDKAGGPFGAELRRVRQELGLTLRDVSEQSGISITYLSDLERGLLTNPTLDTLGALAQALGVSVNTLLGVPIAESRPNRSRALQAFADSRAFLDTIEADALRESIAVDALTEEWLRVLAAIRIRGQTPLDPSDYSFVFEAIRRALRGSR